MLTGRSVVDRDSAFQRQRRRLVGRDSPIGELRRRETLRWTNSSYNVAATTPSGPRGSSMSQRGRLYAAAVIRITIVVPEGWSRIRHCTARLDSCLSFAVPLRQDAVELTARGDAELGEDLAQVVLGRAR